MSIICIKCNKLFSTQSSHNRHVREVHKDCSDPVPYGRNTIWNNRCLEENCDCVFRCNKDLVNHLQKTHLMQSFETQFHCFENMSDFENWKSITESLNNCSYIFKSKHSSTIGEIIYYKCNRSKTNYIAKAHKEKRLPKSQGSCKMNVLCTSEIKVIKENGKILVEYQKCHYGHDLEIQHIRLPKSEKQNIASKLVSGITPQRSAKFSAFNLNF
ncbi:hypothetical protein ABEB36_004719 [Hypothenemus hampei]|uniref:C2H2-type domain-containing protein n=1 Tax=Hypothenemus hampei TaxID=57062 RepID=A0ABD1F4J4_HYPHA